MSSEKKYESAPADIAEAIEQAEVVADFLPSPNQLVLKEETVRVTLNLNRRSVDFFKMKARENGVHLSGHDPKSPGPLRRPISAPPVKRQE